MNEIIVENLKMTDTLAKKFAKLLCGGEIVLLNGDLGAGKTTFVRSVLKYLGVKDNVTSPTFTIMKNYKGNKFDIYHLDVYRFEHSQEIYGCGLDEILFNRNNRSIIFIEWSEKIKDVLPSDCIEVNISMIDNNKRLFKIKRWFMNIFVLDTTRKVAKINIFSDNGDYVVVMDKNVKHSEGLFLYIEKILFNSKINLNDIDVFVSVVGPGSFTGIRIGLATIKGFNKVFNKKTMAITSFDILKKYTKNGVLLLDSTLTTSYFAEVNGGRIVNEGVIEKNKLNEFVNDREIIILEEEQNTFDFEYNKIKVVSDTTEKLKEIIFENLSSEKYTSLEPYYLQLSQAERNLKWLILSSLI